MVDTVTLEESRTGIYSIRDNIDPAQLWFTFIVTSTRLGDTSGYAMKQRLELLLRNTPKMMERAYAAACKNYEISLARFQAWDPVAEEAKYQLLCADHITALRKAVTDPEDGPANLVVPQRLRPPGQPLVPIPAATDFSRVSLVARIAWLQYADFDDAGIEITEILKGPPSSTVGHALAME